VSFYKENGYLLLSLYIIISSSVEYNSIDEDEDRRVSILMIYLIVGILVIITAGALYYEHAQKLNRLDEIDSTGGIVVKYQVLVKYFLSISNAKISSYSKKHLTVQSKGTTTITEFTISPEAENQVTISWILSCQPMGHFKEEWRFSETISQEKMIERINRDLELKSKTINLPDFHI